MSLSAGTEKATQFSSDFILLNLSQFFALTLSLLLGVTFLLLQGLQGLK